MDSRDPPFGYTFTTPEFFASESTPFINGASSLLNEAEHQSLDDFFQNTNTESFIEPPPFSANVDVKDDVNDFTWNYVPPATIHRISTTIPDQAQLHTGFSFHHTYFSEPLSTGPLGNTQDDLQAASTLFTNAQASYPNGRSHSFHGLPSASADPTALLHNMPMVPTPHGLLREPLAAILPHHTENGSIDAQIAAQFVSSQAQQHHDAAMAELARQRPQLKRSYTYGTDRSFNASGFVGPSTNANDEAAAHQLLVGLHRPSFSRQPIPDSDETKVLPPGLVQIQSDNELQSDGATSDEDDNTQDRPTKRRRKVNTSTTTKADKTSSFARKNSTAARPGKNRMASVDEDTAKKKRLSSAGQKTQRENLSDEQKRSNHILSEQKRRNLIKRGFDDLHDLVPEIRNGGLSKSSVLIEAANFLDKLIEENEHFLELVDG